LPFKDFRTARRTSLFSSSFCLNAMNAPTGKLLNNGISEAQFLGPHADSMSCYIKLR